MKIEHTQEEMDAVRKVLDDGSWYYAADIRWFTGITPRTLRHIAETTGTLISGNQGYKRVDMATKKELRDHVKSLRSRAKKISARAKVIEQVLKEKTEK